MNCTKCGNPIGTNDRYCTKCGHTLFRNLSLSNVDEVIHNKNELDQYELSFAKKETRENYCKTIVFVIGGAGCIAIIKNNWGYRDIGEILIICGLAIFIIYAIYSAIAAFGGFYNSGKYLRKYKQLKDEIGKEEAVKIIEESYHPEQGFTWIISGVKGLFNYISGTFGVISGFAVSVIAVILVMSFC